MRLGLAAALAVPVVASVASGAAKNPGSVTLATRGPVIAMAADGNRAALLIAQNKRWRIVVWDPRLGRVTPIGTLTDPGCSRYCGPGGGLALAGTRVVWEEAGAGNTLDTVVSSATLARRRTVSLGAGNWDFSFDGSGDEAFAPAGDGKLLAFTVQVHCADPESEGEPPCPSGREPGDVVAASVWRAARSGRCPSYADYRPFGHCARVAKVSGQLTVLAVDAGRIAARTDHGVRLLSAIGGLLRDFPVEGVRGAALSGNRLALRVGGGVSVYDTSSGEVVFREEGGDRLEDLQSGILVTTAAKTVKLRRLLDGRVATIRTRGFPRAQLERPGLFVAGGRRVTFTPMADLLRRLG
jgi:hypothetical protein